MYSGRTLIKKNVRNISEKAVNTIPDSTFRDLYYFCEPAGPDAELTSTDLAQCGRRMAEYLEMPSGKDHMNSEILSQNQVFKANYIGRKYFQYIEKKMLLKNHFFAVSFVIF